MILIVVHTPTHQIQMMLIIIIVMNFECSVRREYEVKGHCPKPAKSKLFELLVAYPSFTVCG